MPSLPQLLSLYLSNRHTGSQNCLPDQELQQILYLHNSLQTRTLEIHFNNIEIKWRWSNRKTGETQHSEPQDCDISNKEIKLCVWNTCQAMKGVQLCLDTHPSSDGSKCKSWQNVVTARVHINILSSRNM